MKNLKLILLVVLFAEMTQVQMVFAQDARNTQSFGNPLQLNPAMMGANTDMRFIAGYRSQWGAIEKGYTTMSFTAMNPFFLNSGKSKLDVGLNVYNEKAGAFSKLNASLAVGYNLEIAKHNNLSVALMGGYRQNTLDLSSLTFDSQYQLGLYNSGNVTNEASLNQKSSTADASFGLMWFTNAPLETSKVNGYAGISGFHMNQPNESLLSQTSKLFMKFSFQGGIKIMASNKIAISPNARFTVQNGNSETAAGLYVDYFLNDQSKIVLGAWYRKNDAIAFLAGFEHKSFVIGYSYDMVSTPMNRYISGLMSHEITLSFKLSQLKKSSISSFDSGSNALSSSPFSSF